jgi:ketosteroid isomerase-like protein
MGMLRLLVAFFVLALASTACGPTPSMPILLARSPTSSPTAMPASDRESILALMDAEARAALHDDAAPLLEIWAQDGTIRDANHTPQDPADDHTWRGRDAILSRYLTIVFPLHLTQLNRADVQLTITGDTATATASTVIEGEVSPEGEVWTFVRTGGRWLIQSITFNLEPRR